MFDKLGLTYYENKALLALLDGSLTLKQLSEKGIPAGKTSSIIKSLKKKKLVKTTNERPMKASVLSPAHTIGRLIEEQQVRDEAHYAKIRAIITQYEKLNTQPTTFFDLGTTREESERIQLRVFEEAKKEVCQIFTRDHAPTQNRVQKRIWEDAIQKATKKGVGFRAIYPQEINVPSKLQGLDGFVIKRSDLFFTRCDIIDKRKVLLKLSPEDKTLFGGVVFFEDEAFAKNLQKTFENFWQEAQ